MKTLIFLFSMTTFLIQGQGIKKANNKYKKGEYEIAINKYERKLSSKKYRAKANFQIAEAYRLSNRIKQGVPYYEDALKEQYNDPMAHYYLSFGYKELGDYEKAKTQLELYLETSTEESLIASARIALNNLIELDKITSTKNYYKVKNLSNINTKYAEYSPIYKNGELYFISNRQSNKTYKTTGTGFTDIFKVKTKGARVDTSTLTKLPNTINAINANSGSLTFSSDGKTMIFAKGNTGKRRGSSEVNIYISRYRNGAWTEPRILSISKQNSWDSSPALSHDGRTIYFASNRKNSKSQGGIDLYSARINSRGQFSRVQNLGPSINTPGDEMFPYVANDGQLYFSSTGHPGFGGLDLFVKIKKNDQIKIENLGQPINSSSDDFSIFLFKADRGFFTSNREEGRGDDDIYTFVNEDPKLKVVNYFLHGVTLTHSEIDSTQILPYVKVSLIDLEDNVIDEEITDEKGNFNFQVYENENYVLLAEVEGDKSGKYYVTRLDYSTRGKSVPQEELKKLVTTVTYDTLLYLEPIIINKSIVLENIYYDFSQWDIRPDAAQELYKLVDILNDNPEISIELSSHTDSVDSKSYNQRLSQRRAESAVIFIINAGISKSRIVAKGYGESQPIASNTFSDGTDNVEGRQKNRRTEFKVIKINEKQGIKRESEDYHSDDKYFEKGIIIDN